MKFNVELRRTVVEDISMQVDAETAEDAKTKALTEIEADETDLIGAWDLQENETDVIGCYEAT